MNTKTKMLLRLGYFVLVWVGSFAVTGCSLVLDPSYCESNSECQGGVCTNGVCVSPSGPELDMSGLDMGEPKPDATQIADGDVEEDTTVPDAMVRADAQGDVRTLTPPECSISVDVTLTNQPDIEVSVAITDDDDSSETITATLNGQAVTLNRMLSYRGFVNLSEGENVIDLVVVDRDDQRCEDSIIVVSDRTSPVIEMLDPRDGDDVLTNLREVTVRGSVSELHFDESLTILIDDEVFTPDPAIEWASGMFLFRIPLEEGAYDVEISATDRVGNESDPVGFRIESDVVPPVVRLQSPIEGEQLTVSARRYMVRGTVEDDGRVVRNPRVIITVSDGEQEQAYDMPASGIDGSFSQFVELFNGVNTIRACGLDDAGNEHCVEGAVLKNAPCVNIETPQEGAFVGSLTVRLNGTVCAGVDSVEASIDDGAATAGQIEGDRFSVEVRALQSGDHQIAVMVSNGDGDTAEQHINISIDPSPPSLQVFGPEDEVCVSGSVEVTGQAQDDRSGISEVRINATAVESIDLGGGFQQTVEILDGEEVELRVVAVNGAGLETERIRTVRGDSVAPESYFDIMNPLIPVNPWLAPNGAGRIRLSGRIEAGICGLSQGGFSVDGLPVDVVAGRFEFERVYQHGQRTAHWVATDVAGNVREGDYAFRVDSLAPTVEVISPEGGTFQSSDTVLVSLELDDVGVGLRIVRVNGDSILPVLGANGYVAETEVENLVEGPNIIRIEVEDEVGNETAVEVVVHRDVTPVEVAITHPEVGVAVPIPLTVTGTATDGEQGSGVATIAVNGVVAQYEPATGNWTAHGVVVTEEVPQVSITAVDNAGNELLEPLVLEVPVGEYGRQSRDLDGFTVAAAIGWIGIADLNSDGLSDILALSGTADGVSSNYIQIQEGLFVGRPPQVSGVPEAFGFTGAVLGDVDADGRLDLVATGDGASYLLTGVGNGSFRSGDLALPGLPGTVSPELADINRDGRLDLLLMGDGSARLHFGDRDSLLAAEDIATFGLADLAQFSSVSAADVDGDGVNDLVTVGADGGQLWIGDRDDFSFAIEDASGLGQGLDASAQNILWFDVNRDGLFDLFSYGNDGASIHIADANGPYASVDLGIVWRETDRVAAVADLDGDGRDDLLIGGSEGLRLWRNGDGAFVLMDTPLPFDGTVSGLAADDIDGDGDVDIVIGSDSGIHLMRSNRAQFAMHRDPPNPEEHRYIHLNVVRHQLPPNNFDNPSIDGVGALVYVQFLTQEQLEDPQIGAADFVASRAIRANPAGPTLITLGDAAGARIKVHYVDLGGRGSNIRSFLEGIPSGANITSYARE